MMINFARLASECEESLTWPDVTMTAVLVAGVVIVTWVWIVNR